MSDKPLFTEDGVEYNQVMEGLIKKAAIYISCLVRDVCKDMTGEDPVDIDPSSEEFMASLSLASMFILGTLSLYSGAEDIIMAGLDEDSSEAVAIRNTKSVATQLVRDVLPGAGEMH